MQQAAVLAASLGVNSKISIGVFQREYVKDGVLMITNVLHKILLHVATGGTRSHLSNGKRNQDYANTKDFLTISNSIVRFKYPVLPQMLSLSAFRHLLVPLRTRC